MTKRLTKFADEELNQVDMKVKLSKTFSQIVQQQEAVDTTSAAEIVTKEKQYKFHCSFAEEGCTQRFKTKLGMRIHRATCNFGHVTIVEKIEVDKVVEVFGKGSRKLYKVKWACHYTINTRKTNL